MEAVGGDGSKTGLEVKKKRKKNRQLVYECQPHPGLEG